MTDFDSAEYRYRPYSMSAQAVQLTIENAADISAWCDGRLVELHMNPRFVELAITSSEGVILAHEGDWVVKELIHGLRQFDIFDTEDFRETYRPMLEPDATTWPPTTGPIPTPKLETGL